MWTRSVAIFAVVLLTTEICAQAGREPAAVSKARDSTSGFRAKGARTANNAQPRGGESSDAVEARNASEAPRPESTNTPASRGGAPVRSSALGQELSDIPRDHGQVLRKYDIRSYTERVDATAHSEQAVVDWILRETGTDVWFNEPVGFLNAARGSLLVYHTPEMHRTVAEIVDRFVNGSPEPHVLGLRLITLQNPAWRSVALPLLKPVSVQSPGVDAWLASKENAALLLANLRKRADYRELSTGDAVVDNGQTHSIAQLWPRDFVRSLERRASGAAGYELLPGRLDEGYSLQVSPLLAVDERTVDTVLKCNIDQVEKLVPVTVDVPGGSQRLQIQVPQLVSWRFHERFRWPTDEVLILSCGVVAVPGPKGPNALGLQNPFSSAPGRADALLVVEYKGRAGQTPGEPKRSARGNEVNTRGRY